VDHTAPTAKHTDITKQQPSVLAQRQTMISINNNHLTI